MCKVEISIVVPVYNSEKFIERCIKSVSEQSFKDWELLLIDDGSTDSSLDICREYSFLDTRIRIFHQNNGGVSKARLKGFIESQGIYIAFLDSDDALPVDALRLLYDNIQNGYDITIGGMINVMANGKYVAKEHYGVEHGVINSSEQYALGVLRGDVNPYLWGALYKKNIFSVTDFQTIISANLKIGEDWCLKLLCSSRVNKVKIIKDIVYKYFENQNGTMNSSVVSYSYLDKVSLVLNPFKDKASNVIAKELDRHLISDKIRCFFQPELPFSLKEYRLIIQYIGIHTNEAEIKKIVSAKYLWCIHSLPVYFLYTRLFCWLYKKRRQHVGGRKIVD